MIKGVNKRIIEVKEIDSRIFDSALFFVSPDVEKDDAKIEKEANKILERYSADMLTAVGASPKKKSKIKTRLPSFVLGAVSGITIGVLFSKFVFHI